MSVVSVLWLSAVVAGLWMVAAYENGAGANAAAPQAWPASTPLARATDRPTLVFLAHPRCTCTRASMAELAELLARTPEPPKTYVLFLRPLDFEPGWEQTELWESAKALPNATVVRDDGGVEAQRFGVATSGQTILYDERGAMIFSGGITKSRGHKGANAGSAALLALLESGKAERSWTSVFGCPLFASGT
jgi:hypothetical protein